MQSSNYWWLLTLAGTILIALGVFALTSSLNAYIFLVHYSGLIILSNGILLFIVAIKSTCQENEKYWLLAESILDVFFAVCLLCNPFVTFIAYALIIGSWMIGKGALKILAALHLKTIRGWIFIFITGLVSLVFGLLIILFPLTKSTGTTIFIGLFALSSGCFYLLDSIRFRKSAYTLDLMV